MCPIVPTFTWGFFLSNTAFDIVSSPSSQDKPVYARAKNGEDAPSLMAQLHRRSRHGGAEVLQFWFVGRSNGHKIATECRKPKQYT
jgi:hypothetical protein